ncbi:MAG: YicC/YloC family endoribonuclease [Eubacteriaceae bacterium]|nr:YicC/YloC family endoribonuclease [Eubacteriaceae bacterium]
MIKSMTGFGKGEFTDGKRNIVCEIKSVNHRYSDIYVKMPRRYSFAEDRIKSKIKETIKRGKVETSIIVESITEDDLNIKLNSTVAKQYVDNLNAMKKEFGIDGEVTLELLSGMPDVLKSIPDVENEEEVGDAIIEAVKTALDNHDKMRTVEGEKLKKDLEMRGNLIRDHVKEIEKKAPEVGKNYAAKLNDRIKELVGNSIEVPEDRVLLEAAIFADKANITEELVRLDSHIQQLHDILNADSSNGKKLDFLVQEMNREANTIGSKANDMDITNIMLEIKSEVEKIREQVQNIE